MTDQTTAQNPPFILSIDVKRQAPSPLMGEGWGEGEIRNLMSSRAAQPLMVSLSNHVAIPTPGPGPISCPSGSSILFIQVKTRPFPLSRWERGRG